MVNTSVAVTIAYTYALATKSGGVANTSVAMIPVLPSKATESGGVYSP